VLVSAGIDSCSRPTVPGSPADQRAVSAFMRPPHPRRDRRPQAVRGQRGCWALRHGRRSELPAPAPRSPGDQPEGCPAVSPERFDGRRGGRVGGPPRQGSSAVARSLWSMTQDFSLPQPAWRRRPSAACRPAPKLGLPLSRLQRLSRSRCADRDGNRNPCTRLADGRGCSRVIWCKPWALHVAWEKQPWGEVVRSSSTSAAPCYSEFSIRLHLGGATR
jgi:hypothetical protein